MTLAVFGLLTVWVGRDYLVREGAEEAEFYALLLLAVAGMMLMASAADLIMVFLALEMFSIALYVLVAYRRRSLEGQESALKYFLLGSFSSAFFLYGSALVYGATGELGFEQIAAATAEQGLTDDSLLVFGLALMLAGLGFKASAAPFHMWTPDVYEGAPTPVTGYMSAATKVAGFAALLRVVQLAFPPDVLGYWRDALAVLAALSMIVGNLAAVAQTNIKRMLAYSSIAHAGFVLVGVAAGNGQGIAGAMFYLVAYAAMIMGAFAVVILVSRTGERRTSLQSYRGLGRTNPLLAGLLALFLLSLAGIPPLAGFMAKVLVFQAAVDAGLESLVIIAVLASVISAFFYIRVLVLAYMYEPEDEPGEEPARGAPGPAIALAATAAVTLVFGVFPSLLLGFLESAAVLRW